MSNNCINFSAEPLDGPCVVPVLVRIARQLPEVQRGHEEDGDRGLARALYIYIYIYMYNNTIIQ